MNSKKEILLDIAIKACNADPNNISNRANRYLKKAQKYKDTNNFELFCRQAILYATVKKLNMAAYRDSVIALAKQKMHNTIDTYLNLTGVSTAAKEKLKVALCEWYDAKLESDGVELGNALEEFATFLCLIKD